LQRWTVLLMCEVLEVSTNGFYNWNIDQGEKARLQEIKLLILIKEEFELSRRTYGSPRITQVLRSKGVHCYKNQIARIMKKYGITPKVRRKFRITTDSSRTRNIAKNLLNRNFETYEKNQVWVGDITYVWTQEGWLYLSTVIDLYSRKIVGWSVGKRMTKKLVVSPLQAAIRQRKPEAGLIFHSDRGSQYGSDDFIGLLSSIGAVPSMSRKGNCWDNAVAESFFSTIKRELIFRRLFQTRKEAELSIFDYIEIFYNRVRLHSTIGGLSPENFENRCIS